MPSNSHLHWGEKQNISNNSPSTIFHHLLVLLLITFLFHAVAFIDLLSVRTASCYFTTLHFHLLPFFAQHQNKEIIEFNPTRHLISQSDVGDLWWNLIVLIFSTASLYLIVIFTAIEMVAFSVTVRNVVHLLMDNGTKLQNKSSDKWHQWNVAPADAMRSFYLNSAILITLNYNIFVLCESGLCPNVIWLSPIGNESCS